MPIGVTHDLQSLSLSLSLPPSLSLPLTLPMHHMTIAFPYLSCDLRQRALNCGYSRIASINYEQLRLGQ
jgi:hypothetical protein